MSNKIVKSKKDSGGQDGNVTPTTIKKPVTRVNRACDSCRKQKMRCQNADTPPCLRCKTAGIPCTFEKPARESNAMNEAGLERIKSLESQVSTMNSNLNELVGLFRTNKPSMLQDQRPLLSSNFNPLPPQQSGNPWTNDQLNSKRLFYGNSHTNTPDPVNVNHIRSNPIPNFTNDSSITAPSPITPGFAPSSNFQIPPIQQNQMNPPLTSPRNNNNNRRSYFNSTVTSAASTDDEGELPSSAFVAPIEVLRGLADAAAERAAAEAKEAKESKKPKPKDVIDNKNPQLAAEAETNYYNKKRKEDKLDSNNDKVGLKKKKKVDPPHAYADVITKNVISESLARELFDLYFENCHKFLPLFDPKHDTFEELRKRSPFCVTVICMVAARVKDGGGAPSQTYLDCQREAREIAKNSMFLQMTRREAVQALLLFSAFQDNSWLVGGHAVRVAYEVGLDKAIPKLLRRQNKITKSTSSHEDRQIVAAARIWICLYIHEQQLSFGTGRTAFLRDDRGTLSHSRILLNHPLATPTDFRLVSTVELLQIREKVHNELQPFDAPVDAHTFATLRQATVEFDGWFNSWKEHIQNKFPDRQFFVQSLFVQRQYTELFHHAVALRGIRGPLDIAKMSAEQRTVAHIAMRAAQHCLDACIRPGEYGENLKYAVHYTHVCAAFAGSFLLRLAKLFPEDLNIENIIEKVEALVRLLSNTPASRYARSLKLMINRSMRQATPPENREPKENTKKKVENYNTNGSPNVTNDTNISNGMIQTPSEVPIGSTNTNGFGMDTSTSTPNSQTTFSSENVYTPGLGLTMSGSGELPLWLQETNLGDLGLTNTGTEAFFLPSEDFNNFALL